MLGQVDYARTYSAMRLFTDGRLAETPDELWALEHPPVFTQGQAGKAEHVLAPGDIPVIQTDRGGQVTYHGPGQLVIYLLVDLKRRGLGVRQMVTLIEDAIIDLLASEFDLQARADPKAPGVYVDGRKIAALGLRVRKGCTFHGLSLNVDCDLDPFARINPCGYQGLAVTSVQKERPSRSLDIWTIGEKLQSQLSAKLSSTES
jgi:lipoyl(octanoyl) transferase